MHAQHRVLGHACGWHSWTGWLAVTVMEGESEDLDSEVKYFIDVVEQSNRFGILKDSSFKALSNFKIDISSEVKDGGPLSGYTCTVTQLRRRCCLLQNFQVAYTIVF